MGEDYTEGHYAIVQWLTAMLWLQTEMLGQYILDSLVKAFSLASRQR